ncbi:ECF transporter S component [Viridibacillus sp. YIM B01967]|uniref:ECF transporter S component n=2 Tax=Viridibacillus soli TaxID=2798301 RepID=A0ABS1H8D0_9BACL|nr:ECF transporter S component [Viridibacillus soli]
MKLRTLTLTAIIAALCAVGSMIKVPVGISSAALDSAPAFLGAVFLPPVAAGAAAAIGHLVSAMTGGFALGPLHFLIAAEMFLVLWGFAKLHHAGRTYSKWIFAIIANGILSPLPFYWIISPAFFFSAVPGIFIATVLNITIAAIGMPVLSRAFQRKEAH